MMRQIYGDYDRYVSTYFSSFPGYYFTGDGCRQDEDGYYWITGRVDDAINVSGHLLSTAEIESSQPLVSHPEVVEAAVVAVPHDIKGHAPYAFVVLTTHLTNSMIGQLKRVVREKIGAIAVPDYIQEVSALPRTCSGKVTRRILRKIAEGDPNADLGDTSILVDPSVIAFLWKSRKQTN